MKSSHSRLMNNEEETKMKITTFNPMILSPKAEDVIALFEELGFERRH